MGRIGCLLAMPLTTTAPYPSRVCRRYPMESLSNPRRAFKMERSWTPSLAPPSGPDLTRQRAHVRETLQTQIEKGREIERRSIKTTEDRLAQISNAANWTEYNI